MASLSFAFLSFSLLLLFALLGQCSGEQFATFHSINIDTLLSRNVCSSLEDPEGLRHVSLKVVHRHGPCSPLNRQQNLDHKQILDKDQSRVNAIHRRVSANSRQAKPRNPRGTSAIPVHPGDSLDTDYIVTIGFGSPKRDQSVTLDTGSDVTWIQCKPCVVSCYQQQEPIFDPSHSSTYANISCRSSYCSELDNSGYKVGCTPSTCVYDVQYGDNSSTLGFFAEDTLTLTSSDVLRNFRFGCGQWDRGLFGEAAGLLGLGRQMVSVVWQSFQRYGGVFSYCLPSTSSSTGYLKFGGSLPSSHIKTTPMLTKPNAPAFYFLELEAIYVGGRRLSIPSTVFSNVGTIMDSGTVITTLPPAAYRALRKAFRKAMSSYKSAPTMSNLDTCYDITGHDKVSPPTVALQFGGGIDVDLDPSGILYTVNKSYTCLAFARNNNASDPGIIGSTQQRKLNVVYDVSKKVIGFGPNGC